MPGNKYKLIYTYTLSGQLKSLKDPFNYQSDYSFDKTGRATSIIGSGYGDLPSTQAVVSDMQYRAFGSLKQANYGNGTQTAMQYNDRLQPSVFRLTDTSNNQILFGKDYYYTTGANNDNDGLVKRSVHYNDAMYPSDRSKQNRTNTYDAQGRIASSDAGELGITPLAFGSTMTHGSFQQKYTYDVFGNLKGVNDRDFETNVTGCVGCPRFTFYGETFVNNRTTFSSYSAGGQGSQTSVYEYDQDGRPTRRGDETYQYNAAGRRVSADMTGTTPDPGYGYDGDGKLVKTLENGAVKNYQIISSVLGVTVSEATNTGAMETGYILSERGARIASMKDGEVKFIHNEPSGAGEHHFKMNRTLAGGANYDPTGRPPSNSGYTGGGPCFNNCPSPYNPPGGFDGLGILMARRNQERWQDTMFWNLSLSVSQNITTIIGISPPADWDPYKYNLNRISDGSIYNPSWGRSEGWESEQIPHYGNENYRRWINFFLPGQEFQTKEPNAYKLSDLLIAAEEIVKNATGECAKLLGKGALSEFQKNSKLFEYDKNNRYVPSTSAARTYDSGSVFLNPWHYVFNPDARSMVEVPKGLSKVQRKYMEGANKNREFWAKEIKDAGVSEYAYAVGAILHEFLHQTGEFEPHTQGTRESVNDQMKVIKNCIKGNEPKL